MLVTYGHRREPHGVRGCLSEDGVVWNPSNEFVIREVVEADYLVCYPFRAPECIKLNAAIFRFTLVLSDLNVFT